jgi:YD repeat-containing protein
VRRGLLVVLAVLSVSRALVAQEYPMRESGFAPDRVLAMGDIDHVNFYSGNLLAELPIGQSYRVGGGLSYGLKLIYSGSPWRYKEMCSITDNIDRQDGDDPTYVEPPFDPAVCHTVARLIVRSAGVGWNLSLGRLQPSTPNVYLTAHWIYEAPDGSVHTLYPTLHDGEASTPGYYYSRDGMYLRLHEISPSNTATLEFPDGTIQTFDELGRLTAIRDRFDNELTAGYAGMTTTLHDSAGRDHEIHYKIIAHHTVVSSVELTSFDGGVVTYTFTYEGEPSSTSGTVLQRPCVDDHPNSSDDVRAPILHKIQVTGDGVDQSWSMTTFAGSTCIDLQHPLLQNEDAGALMTLTLPTKGELQWTYQPFAGGGEMVAGVKTRELVDADGTSLGVWNYCVSSTVAHATKVTDPGQTSTEYYFNADGQNPAENALPFTRAFPDSEDPAKQRFLSSTTTYAGSVLRKSYVRYQYDQLSGCNPFDDGCFRQRNQRVVSTRTLFADDTEGAPAGGRYIDTDSASFDGLGHYREQTITGTFDAAPTHPERRVDSIDYNVAAGTYIADPANASTPTFYPPSASAPWLLNTYAHRITTATTVQGGADDPQTVTDTATVETDFDPATGALRGERTWQYGQRGAHDLLKVNTFDDSGNVKQEDFYGGDAQALNFSAATPLSTLSLPQHPEFRLIHSYAFGSITSSQWVDFSVTAPAPLPYKSLDLTIDASTGLASKSRDTAGLVTTYSYDALSRLKEVCAPAQACVDYTYDLSSSPASVVMKQGTAPSSREVHYSFDGLGRLTIQAELMPDAQWSYRKTDYDLMGRIYKAYAPVSSASATGLFTEYHYDPLGRTATVTTPDQAVHSTTYTGARVIERKSKVRTDPNPTVVDTEATIREEYDIFGRLRAVVEKPSASATEIRTEYDYDVGNRLSGVRMYPSTGATAQQRTFGYDHRGFLTQETHPESGTTSYRYDSRGHVLSSDAAGTGFDLRNTYDAAEHLVTVKRCSGACDAATAGAAVKTFQYDAGNGRLNGATRYNDVPGESTIVVKETYGYDAGGRPNARTTEITDSATGEALIPKLDQSIEYDDLNLVSETTYPECTGGICGMSDVVAISATHEAGRLKTVPGYIDDIAYGPEGMWTSRTHANQVVDRQVADPGMGRPKELSFDNVSHCADLQLQPVDVPVTNGTAVFTARSGERGAQYTWYAGTVETAVLVDAQHVTRTADGGSQLTVSGLTSTTTYWCRVTAGQCVVNSNLAQAIVCESPQIIVPDSDYNAGADPVTAGTAVTASVNVESTGVSYVWWRQKVTWNGQRWDNLDQQKVSIGGPTSSISWTPTADDSGSWGIYVTVSGICADSTPQMRLVKVVAVTTAQVCTIPDAAHFDVKFPPVIRMPAGHDTFYVTANPAVGQEGDYKFEWSLDGTVFPPLNGAAASNFSGFVRDGRTVRVRVWHDCTDALSSIVELSTFIYPADKCPKPVLSLDQTAIVPASLNKTFTASSPWNDVTFKWYMGDSGNTDHEVLNGISTPHVDFGAQSQLTPGVGAGTLWVRAFSPCGESTDGPTLTVTAAAGSGTCSPIEVLTQPKSAEVHAGQAYQLWFETGSTQPVTVDWFQALPVRNLGDKKTLTVNPTHTTQYWATMSNACDSTDTARATVHVVSCDDITVQAAPQAETLTWSQDQAPPTTDLIVNASSQNPLSYQWYAGESGDTSQPVGDVAYAPYAAYAGHTNRLQVPVTATTAFWVRVTTESCSIDLAATVNVCAMPKIRLNPASATTVAHFPRWLSVDALGTNLTYDWFEVLQNGSLHELGMAADPSTLIDPLITTKYMVRVANDCGSVDSAVATISIRPFITTQPVGSSVTSGDAYPLSVVASGTFLKYKWYTGTDDHHAVTASDNDGPSYTPTVNADTIYWVRVWSGDAWVDSNQVAVSVCPAHEITISPGRTGVSGERVVMSVSGADAEETFAWYAGQRGDTSTPVGGGTTVFVEPKTTTSYWVRATRTTCHADSQTQTVFICLPRIVTQPAPQTINTNQQTTLSVVATGDALTYRWYTGESGDTSHPVTSETTSATLSTGVLTTTTRYWVRVTNQSHTGCSNTHADSVAVSVTVVSVPIAVATAQSGSVVGVSWSYAPGADSFDIERCGSGTVNCTSSTGFVKIGSTTGMTYSDTTALASRTYLYRVRAIKNGTASPPSAPDVATTVMFDDALVAPMPLVRAQHVLQLRTAVNAVRAAAGLAAVTFTPATLTGINVSAAHLVDLRNALAEARTTLGLPAMRDTSVLPAAGGTILAVHVTDLRGGVQ